MPASRLLDVTRTLRRAGRMATGVDRVEQAYLAQFLSDDTPCFGLARTPLGYLLLDRAGLQGIQDRVDGRAGWGAPDLLSRFRRGRAMNVRRAEADFRRLAIARAAVWRLPRLVKKLPMPCQYYNVGHSNLSPRVLSTLHEHGIDINVMIHDVIPLEYPQYQRPGSVEPFREKLKNVQKWADRIIYNSADTKARAEAQMAAWGETPAGIVAHLGTVLPQPDASELPQGLPPAEPYFVTVGTIEPRKNHKFLLDIWDEMGPDAPLLLICGGRGWNNDAVFDRLDAMGPKSRVREVANLSDPALAALVQSASGSLFPSFTEGFGLPPLEAVMLKTPVLCNELDVLHEFLGDIPVYAGVSDHYQWIRIIENWADTAEIRKIPQGFQGPTWKNHFNIVLSPRA
ncbi:Glycosyltransferase involved in cell wall bisynthesis [Sulfitobacter marinus]|uniref:Glycosyltransferase involved in cell wall bisynthesis n=1 Tax=Sulfitobacter marinus TaxID=394264 RepID=A0A1I6T097_9RHOB|nr:glycosyltransferase [Sulfitobacter marinus]SFS82437.1 Glycosyltransferase involved in cell wall bisynthesis [Sulfitobacter marinus]